MIKEFEFYHGVVFTQIIHAAKEGISVKPYPTEDNASYVINDKVGLYIKYSTKRLSPWTFSFQDRHQDEMLEMKTKIGEVFLLLVCSDDGVVILSFNELKQILDESHGKTEWISVARSRRKLFSVKGSDGELQFKVARNDFLDKIFHIINGLRIDKDKSINSVDVNAPVD